MIELAMGLMLWLSSIAPSYSPDIDPPLLVLGSQDTIVEYIELEHTLSVEEQDYVRENILAIYLPDPPRIVMGSEVDLETVYGKSVLVHELVHHYQHVTKASVDCPAERERDAYILQNEYLVQNGEVPGTDPFTIFIRSSCGP